MSNGRRVVVADPLDPGAIDRLRDSCTLIDASADPAKLPAALADAWGLIVRSRTKVTRQLLASAPSLKLVARAGVGVDNVDLDAAAEHHLTVVNVPSAATVSVAELTIALYLWMVRGLFPKVVATKVGRWERGTGGHELSGRTVGFVGFGRIGREIARRLGPFGVKSIAYDPFVKGPIDGVELVPLDRLLAEADIVSVHAALTPKNRHLVDARAFARMKRGAFLVNVARGPLVDETALLAALAGGHLAGAALDVFEEEPPMNRALLEHPLVIATPHLGAATVEAQARAGREVVDEVLRALHDEPLTSVVPLPGGSP